MIPEIGIKGEAPDMATGVSRLHNQPNTVTAVQKLDAYLEHLASDPVYYRINCFIRTYV
jgi:hypothetical protein